MQALLQRLSHRGLARPRQARQPDDAALMAVQQLMGLARNSCGAVIDMGRLIRHAGDDASRDRDAAAPVDQDKGALGGVVAEGVDSDRRRQDQPTVRHLIGRQRLARQRQPRRQGPRAQFDLIATVGAEGPLAHPQQTHVQPIRGGRPVSRMGQDIAARHIGVFGQH
ncbi:hypothetical protein D3C85_1171810 [compost metagenome]